MTRTLVVKFACHRVAETTHLGTENVMKQVDWIKQGPSFVLACGIVAATWVAAHSGGHGVRAFGGMAVLALATLAADRWNRQLRGRSAGTSWAALLLVAGFAGASAIMINGNAGSLRTMIPTFGILAWVTLLNRPDATRLACRPMTKTGQGS
jgi:hypothetical protein